MEYLYRDASNYKVQNAIVVDGTLTQSQIETICKTLNDDRFIPEQIGLPANRFEEIDPDEDHCWFELYASGFYEVEAEPSVDAATGKVITAQDLVERFVATNGQWDDVTYAI